jgi:anti-sigma-K factor RskA
MKSANRELVDRLAAEYALGTLRGGARRHFARWLRSPQVRAMVQDWEERLAGLEPPLRPIEPPAEVWAGLAQRLALRRMNRAPALRWVVVGAAVIALSGAAILLLR